jgi:hypothetical protein
MRPTTTCSILIAVLAGAIGAGCGRTPTPTQLVKSFSAADATVAKDLQVTDHTACLAHCTTSQVVRLFEVPDPDLEQCTVIYLNVCPSQPEEQWSRFE